MRVYTQWADIPAQERLVTVGTFDGVHCGHQALLKYLRRWAQQVRLPACVVTFEPHPQLVLGRQPPLGILTPLPLKRELLQRIGIDELVVAPFTPEFARTSAEEFIRHYLVERLHARGILVGHDHMFGHGRQGNLELLRRYGAELGFTVEYFPPVVRDGLTVSSSLIRRMLHAGDVDTAVRLLGHPYTVCGTVVRGDGRGTRLGFPTANLQPDDPHQLLPAYGVYIVSTHIAGRLYAGLASYGVRPTFGSGLAPQLEVYLLDFSGQLYNEHLCVSFWSRVRAEERFPDADALQRQMQADEAYCRQWLQHHAALIAGSTICDDTDGNEGTQS